MCARYVSAMISTNANKSRSAADFRRMARMRIVLFGLTGYTNEILPAIRADGRLELSAVFTRRYDAPYPYYPLPQIHEVCAGLGIPCHTNLRVNSGTGFELLRGYEPDLILMTGFHQILTPPVLDLPRLGVVNMHPS